MSSLCGKVYVPKVDGNDIECTTFVGGKCIVVNSCFNGGGAMVLDDLLKEMTSYFKQQDKVIGALRKEVVAQRKDIETLFENIKILNEK